MEESKNGGFSDPLLFELETDPLIFLMEIFGIAFPLMGPSKSESTSTSSSAEKRELDPPRNAIDLSILLPTVERLALCV
jgi:hypothetical protein